MLNTLQGWAFPWKDAGGPQHPRPGNLKSFKVFESLHQKLKFSKVLFSKFLKAFIKSFNFKSFWKHIKSACLTSTPSTSYRVSRLQARHSYFDNKKVCFSSVSSLKFHVQQEGTCVLAQSRASSCTHHPGHPGHPDHPAQPNIVTTVPLNCTIQALPEWFLQYCADFFWRTRKPPGSQICDQSSGNVLYMCI